MRNLKKLLAVVIAVCVLATMMIPAFAAETKTEAQICEALGVLKGDGAGVTDTYLAKGTERFQAALIYLRLLGLEDEAVAFAGTENFEDATDIKYEGGQKALAYLKANPDLGWIGVNASGTKFEPTSPASAQMIYKVMLEALGYKQDVDFEWADTITFAKDKGLSKIADVTNLTNNDLAIALVEALKAKVKDSEKTLAQVLIEKGIIDQAAAIEAGLVSAVPVIVSVKATAVDTLEVTFSQAVDTEDITLAVTRNGVAVPGTVAWNADKTVATITTTAKMVNGVHTVTASSKADTSYTSTGSIEIKSQYIAEIKILNDVALTGPDSGKESMRAFVYYDVLDQYGQSVRSTTNITWSFSAKQESIDRTTGKITLSRSDGNAFTYGEQIYISGVDTKTGVAVTKTVTVGQKQALNSIELAGFLKKGTTEILKGLPSGFKADTYYMLYTVKDQNGNPFDVVEPIKNNQVTIIADNMLLINKFGPEERQLSINGKEYNAVIVQPGINVDKGGEVNITAIANNTGNKVVINTVVGANQILTTFNMSLPAGILADGETIEIPFEAYDQNGDKITNFTTLARNTQFNALTFNASQGKLKLSEKDDGTAKLEYIDTDGTSWTSSTATDGIDRVVSLTSIVVGGNNSTLMLNIQDKARPEGIKSVNIPSVVVEQGTFDIEISGGDNNKIIFVDQYGREMKKEDAEAFFKASKETSFTGHGNPEFNGYKFVVRATYKGDDDIFSVGGTSFGNNATFEILPTAADKKTFTAKAGTTATAKSGMAFQFDIVKYKTADGFGKAVAVSTNKTYPITVVDINAVKGFTIKDIAKVYVETTKSEHETGDVDLTPTTIGNTVGSVKVPDSHKRSVEVTGTYNGVSVSIPSVYLKVTASKVPVDGTEIKGTTTGALKWSDLYDATTARYIRKDASDTIKVTILDLDDGAKVIDSTSKTVALSDAKPKATTIEGKASFTVTPDMAVITVDKIEGNSGGYKVKDQYGVDFTATKTYRVTNIAENADAYAANSFKVAGNDSNTMSISGAERGDKFTLVIKADNAELTVEVTVGADVQSNIENATNNYLGKLIKDVLEDLRKAGLN